MCTKKVVMSRKRFKMKRLFPMLLYKQLIISDKWPIDSCHNAIKCLTLMTLSYLHGHSHILQAFFMCGFYCFAAVDKTSTESMSR